MTATRESLRALVGVLTTALVALLATTVHAQSVWSVGVPAELRDDPAVRAGLKELANEAGRYGIRIDLGTGNAENRLKLVLSDSAVAHVRFGSEGFAWYRRGGEITLEACTALGLAYGLFDLTDEVATTHQLPRSNRVCKPTLKYRVLEVGPLVPGSLEGPRTDEASLAAFRKRWQSTLSEALRYGYNILRVHSLEDFVPWEDPHYGPRSAVYRMYLRAAADLTHAYHLKLLLAGDEFIYLPELVGGDGVDLSVKSDLVWTALAEKYRKLLQAAPYLDGVSTRIGEVIPRYDFRHLDLIHAPADSPDPRIEERYRRFLWTVYGVVVGEFGKLYLHRTWVTNNWEQHSVPEIYKRIFEDLPERNLLVGIKITKTDQWYYWVPFNPTFGLTPHATLAQAELGSAAHGGGVLLDFPGFWYAAGLRYAVWKGAQGVLASVFKSGPGAEAASAVFAKLAWEPQRNASDLLLRWLRRTYGDAAAPVLADVFQMSSEAIRDGLYVRPWALQEWNPIPHLRGRTFMYGGRPLFDHGKGHDRFLRSLYLQAKPWGDETLKDLDRGLETADSMLVTFQRIETTIPDTARRNQLDRLLRHGLVLMRLNRAYVADILRYFRYRETREAADRKALARANGALEHELRFYKRYFNEYNVRALEILLSLSRAAVKDVAALEDSLRSWPDDAQITARFQRQMSEYREVLRRAKRIRPLYQWKGTVDGSDLFTFEDDSVQIEHFLWEYPQQAEFETLGVYEPGQKLAIRLRRGRGTVVLVPGKGKRSISVYVEDPAPGADVYDFDVVAVEN